jgi:hypothetical protein
MPWRRSSRGALAWTAYSPNRALRDGNHGTGATTLDSIWPHASRCRSRVSTNMPWLGRAELGYSVLNVSIFMRVGAVA